ncbi:DUF3761 domain-containing protein [Candidatus Uhrbacteria bacterium]|nr:DUF3761 domain-containing protein [Candidatus Uhrbacteria bacterium]
MKRNVVGFLLAVALLLSPIGAATSFAYTNVKGNSVPSPVKSIVIPKGATAKCKDGTYSFSQTRQGTCSKHKGVAIWYK